MKKTIVNSLLGGLALLFASCGSQNTVANGIHDSAAKSSLNDRLALSTTRPMNGGTPTTVNSDLVAKAAHYPRDKHGMPTYSHSERNRIVRTTAYSHMEMEPGAPGRLNAIGTTLSYGNVRSAAADWSVYPVGTRFKIKGLPYTYVVDDFGSSLVGTNTIDIFHPTLGLMNQWGTRKVEITVTQWGSMERVANILSKRKRHDHCRRMYYAAVHKLQTGQVAVASN